MDGGHCDNALLHVDHHQRGNRIDLRERHGVSSHFSRPGRQRAQYRAERAARLLLRMRIRRVDAVQASVTTGRSASTSAISQRAPQKRWSITARSSAAAATSPKPFSCSTTSAWRVCGVDHRAAVLPPVPTPAQHLRGVGIDHFARLGRTAEVGVAAHVLKVVAVTGEAKRDVARDVIAVVAARRQRVAHAHGVVGVDAGIDRRQRPVGQRVLQQPLDRGAIRRRLHPEGAIGLAPHRDGGNGGKLGSRPALPAGLLARGDLGGKCRRACRGNGKLARDQRGDVESGIARQEFGDGKLHRRCADREVQAQHRTRSRRSDACRTATEMGALPDVKKPRRSGASKDMLGVFSRHEGFQQPSCRDS